ncbi:NUDIX hydrolase [Bacillus sp. JJ1122]|uniref:NUDIX hydrolase n=1 Tax=Bacillus sp. JJ1122 TaxID=3122951 RepID=UPI002FFF5E11
MDATFYLEGAVFNYRVAAVIVKDGHVLIHKQGTDSYWALPGGRVEVMEDSQTSIIREMKEELGLDAKVERLLWFTENFFDYNDKNYHEIGLYYQVEIVDERFVFSTDPFYGEEGERLIYQWVPVEKLEEIILYPEFLKAALLELPLIPQHLIVRK